LHIDSVSKNYNIAMILVCTQIDVLVWFKKRFATLCQTCYIGCHGY